MSFKSSGLSSIANSRNVPKLLICDFNLLTLAFPFQWGSPNRGRQNWWNQQLGCSKIWLLGMASRPLITEARYGGTNV